MKLLLHAVVPATNPRDGLLELCIFEQTGIGVLVGVLDAVGVLVMVGVNVIVGVLVIEGVNDGVRVFDGVNVGVRVGEGVIEGVFVMVGVLVGMVGTLTGIGVLIERVIRNSSTMPRR